MATIPNTLSRVNYLDCELRKMAARFDRDARVYQQREEHALAYKRNQEAFELRRLAEIAASTAVQLEAEAEDAVPLTPREIEQRGAVPLFGRQRRGLARDVRRAEGTW